MEHLKERLLVQIQNFFPFGFKKDLKALIYTSIPLVNI